MKFAQLKLFYLAQRMTPPHSEESISLNLFKVDEVYRCKGRIEESQCSYSAKFPILLPTKKKNRSLI